MTPEQLARRRRAQSGTTLVELLVSVMIIGLALVLLVGAFSSGIVQSKLTTRNTAAETTIRYELEQVGAAEFDTTPNPFSECFATDSLGTHTVVAYGAPCPSGSTLRADVIEAQFIGGVQKWTVTVMAWPSQATVGSPVSTLKVDR